MSNEIFEEKYNVKNTDVDSLGYMKISRIFDVIHDVANHSMRSFGLEKEKLVERNLLWVVGEQTLEIEELPRIGDSIAIATWVGEEFSLFIPRFYELKNDAGKSILKASAIWAVIDAESRRTIKPSSKDVSIAAIKTGNEISILNTPKAIEITESKNSSVLPEYIDFNNHMNNAKYFDLVDSMDSIVKDNLLPKKVIARYSHEAFLGDELTISRGKKDDSVYYSIDTGNLNHFKLRIEY